MASIVWFVSLSLAVGGICQDECWQSYMQFEVRQGGDYDTTTTTTTTTTDYDSTTSTTSSSQPTENGYTYPNPDPAPTPAPPAEEEHSDGYQYPEQPDGVQNSNTPLNVDDACLCRNYDDEPWLDGEVKSLQPLEVQVPSEYTPSEFTQVAPNPMTAPLDVGDNCRCRENDNEPWQDGIVTSVDPLLVSVPGNAQPKGFNQVRPNPAAGLDVGDSCLCKDDGEDRWREGQVSAVNPIVVQVPGCDAKEYDQVIPEPLVHCEGTWNPWGSCSKNCGIGERTRTFEISRSPVGDGDICPTAPSVESCNTQSCPVDCEYEYTQWGACSESCGTGKRQRQLNIIKIGGNGGKECPVGGTMEWCNTQDCPSQNCQGSWGSWGSCSKECGTGTKMRSFNVAQHGGNGGDECPTTESKECNGQPCPVDCAYHWSEWGDCSKSCGSGYKSRSLVITTEPEHGGMDCPSTGTSALCNSHSCPSPTPSPPPPAPTPPPTDEVTMFDPTKCALQRGDDSKCTKCLTTDQCQDAYGGSFYCCPYMKRCVSSGSMGCYTPVAYCSPLCYETTYANIKECSCRDSNFPDYWLDGCTIDDPPQQSLVVVNPPSPSPAPNDEISEWLFWTNRFRCWHNAEPLTWSDAMAQDAAEYLPEMGPGLVHSDSYNLPDPYGPAGENLAYGYGSIEEAVSAWYNEYDDCSQNPWDGCRQSSPAGKMVGHFTALVWKGALEMGCAWSPPTFICRYRATGHLTEDTPNTNAASGNYIDHVERKINNLGHC